MDTVTAVCEECGQHFQAELRSRNYETISASLTCDAGHSTDLYFALDPKTLPSEIVESLDRISESRGKPIPLYELFMHVAFKGYLDGYLEGPQFRNRDFHRRFVEKSHSLFTDVLSQPPLSESVIVASGVGDILDPSIQWVDTVEGWRKFVADKLSRLMFAPDMTEDGESTWSEAVGNLQHLCEQCGILELDGKPLQEVFDGTHKERQFQWHNALDNRYREAFWKYDREEIDILELEEAMKDLATTAAKRVPDSTRFNDSEALVAEIFSRVEDRKPTPLGYYRELRREVRQLKLVIIVLAIALAVVAYSVPAINDFVSRFVKEILQRF
jgi:hypothetical protein